MHARLPLAALSLWTAVASAAENFYYVPNSCNASFPAGRDVVTRTIAYPWTSVLPIIQNFNDLTWSGNPPNTITLNGTNNHPGTARFYSLQGVQTVETLLTYRRPIYGVYTEVHNTAPVSFGAVTAWIPFDSTTATPICGGQAVVMNMTTNFCSNDPTTAAALLHSLHGQDMDNVSQMLGGRKYTNCADLTWQNGINAPAAAASQVSSVAGSVWHGIFGP